MSLFLNGNFSSSLDIPSNICNELFNIQTGSRMLNDWLFNQNVTSTIGGEDFVGFVKEV